MTPAQQAAKWIEDFLKEKYVDIEMFDQYYRKDFTAAFLAGYYAAEGSFAEYCSTEGWAFHTHFKQWNQAHTGLWKTTGELMEIWKQENNK